MTSTIFDINIIGGGPIGLYAAGLAGEMGASCNIIESMPYLGGVMMVAYPDKDIFNFPGVPVIKGRTLINDLTAKVVHFKQSIRLGEYVDNISRDSNGIINVRSNKGEYLSSSVLITTGLKAYYSNLMDTVEIRDWGGTGIYDTWPQPFELIDTSVAVILASNNELEIPDDIWDAVKSITFARDKNYEGARFPEIPAGHNSKARVSEKPWHIKQISGDRIPESIKLANAQSGEEKSIKVDKILGFYDTQARQTIFSRWGIEMADQHIKVDSRMQTNLRKIYAAGDIAWYPGKVRLLSSGITEARIAVKNALRAI